ncbi:MAG: LamG-like jellyroll fold domain-containing protein, partial [Armatimonadota bacterium]
LTWTAMAYNFDVEKAGVVMVAIIGQERGLAVDQIAVVKGTYETGQVKLADLPGGTLAQGQVGLADLPRMKSQCSLKAVPDAPFRSDANTVLHESFDGAVTGAVGDHSQAEGKFGRALYLSMPDGRFDVDASSLDLGPTGTIEYWVRPRPGQRLWHDQGWHYFLHCKPPGERGFQLDLSRHSRTNLRLTASMGGKPMDKDLDPREDLQVSTSDLDLEAWHHMLVSWDLSGNKQYLWLMVDGRGVQLFFDRRFDPRARFSKIEIGNTPSGWDVPYLHIDGAIDELKISNVSVAGRLAQ